MHMYLCVYTYICISIDLFAHPVRHDVPFFAFPGMYRYNDIYMCIYAYICMCVYIYMHIFRSFFISVGHDCLYSLMFLSSHFQVWKKLEMYICLCVYMCAFLYIYIYVYISMGLFSHVFGISTCTIWFFFFLHV